MCGSSSLAVLAARRPAMGKAEIPAAPISGLILPPVSTHINFPNNKPATVSSTKANKPKTMILPVSRFKNAAALIVAPMARPKNNVAMLMISFCAALLKRSTTPETLSRFPSMSIEMSGVASGTSKPTTSVSTMGNSTSVFCEMGLGA